MQEVTKEELKQLIEEAKKAGKDTSELEAEMERVARAEAPPMGQKKEKKEGERKIVIESTGPVKEEDFK